MMLNADVSDGFFQSKFGDGIENFQNILENSDQSSLRIMILMEFYNKSYLTEFYWSFVGILSDCARNYGGKSMRLQLMKITYPHILFHPNG